MNPAPDTPVTLALVFSDVQILLEALGEMPAKRVFPVISKIIAAIPQAPAAAAADGEGSDIN